MDGAKGFKSVWLGNSDKLLSVGFSKNSERTASLFDVKKMDKPLSTITIDHGSGMISPYFDAGTNVLFMSGKGDTNIKMFEINEEAPNIHFLTEYSSSTPANGFAILPKLSCNVRNCEVAKFLKLSSDIVEPLTFSIPRTRVCCDYMNQTNTFF